MLFLGCCWKAKYAERNAKNASFHFFSSCKKGWKTFKKKWIFSRFWIMQKMHTYATFISPLEAIKRNVRRPKWSPWNATTLQFFSNCWQPLWQWLYILNWTNHVTNAKKADSKVICSLMLKKILNAWGRVWFWHILHKEDRSSKLITPN